MRAWFILAILIVVAVVSVGLVRLHPPKELSIAAGPDAGAYVRIAEAYRDILARDGIKLTIMETAGSNENASIISQGEADSAILQGGIAVENPDIETIGGIFFEPISFLARRGVDIASNPAFWKGLRISSGSPGSGTAVLFRDFEKAVGLAPGDNEHMSLSYSDAVAALIRGEIDIAVFVAPVDAPYLVAAYNQPSIRFLTVDYSDAISRRLSYANHITIPAGALSLKPVLPAEPRQTIALEARLAIRPGLHPAIVNRLTMAAKELHGARGIITDPDTFPTVEGTGLRVNNAARQLILEGPSTWFDWLPYWIAAQINRFLLLLLPFVFIVLPLLRSLPGLYAFLMRWRVWQHYPEIRQIEEQLDEMIGPDGLDEMEARLAAVDERLSQLRLPAAYRQTSYEARVHIGLVQKRIDIKRHAQQAV